MGGGRHSISCCGEHLLRDQVPGVVLTISCLRNIPESAEGVRFTGAYLLHRASCLLWQQVEASSWVMCVSLQAVLSVCNKGLDQWT